MKIKTFVEDLKAKSVAELNEELVAAKKELFNLRFQNATNQLDNTSRIKEVRKNIEGIQGCGGINVPTASFMQTLAALCRKYGTVLILDEVQSGYGRTGRFFAHQWYGIRPDIITMGKGIANGFPCGGILISPEFKAVKGMLGTTFGGNYLAMAAAISVLDVIAKENLVENALKVGEHILANIPASDRIKEVRGKGCTTKASRSGKGCRKR